MISVVNLTKKYGSRKAVDRISFEVPEGAILGLLGANGAGKTTTMRILTCFFPPTEGTAKVAGLDIVQEPVEVKRHVGYMPENPPLYADLQVADYLRFVAALKEVPRRQINQRVESVMGKLHILNIRDRIIGHLSRGYRQRVGLAQAMIHDPKVLILDEPTLGLDPTQIIEIRDLIRNLGGKHTVVLSSHILSEVQATCTHVAIIHRGRIVACDRLQNLTGEQKLLLTLRLPESELGALRESLGSIDGVRDLETLPAAVAEAGLELRQTLSLTVAGNIDTTAESISRLMLQRGNPILELSRKRTSLEDIFLRAVGGEDGQASDG